MRISSFIKRLNATELGLGATHDYFIALPREVDLSSVFMNKQAITIFDRVEKVQYDSTNSNIKYVQTGQNNQERISGLGKYFEKVKAKVGDEILIERIDTLNGVNYFMDFHHRNAIVFQKNKLYVEILTTDDIQAYKTGDDYLIKIYYNNEPKDLCVKFIKKERKKKISPNETDFFDLLIDNKSILKGYSYQDYIEILLDNMRMNKMKTWIYSNTEWED